MTNPRMDPGARIKLRHVAEREINRYRGDHALWHKHVHNITLDAMQVLKMAAMDEHPNTIDFSCRRTGKTFVKELWFLEFLATHSDQELGIVAPREAQSVTNLGYHLDAIRRSEILQAYIANKSGRRQMSDTRYELANRSKAQAYGIMAQVDGGDLTVASLEEVDDMPRDRLYSRFLLMLASARRAGAAADALNAPRIRITGVYKGADTLAEMVASGGYEILPTINAYLGRDMNILQAEFIDRMQKEMAPDEYIRQLLCINVSAKNLIWEKHVREAMTLGLAIGLDLAEPMPLATYKKRGLVSFGYDAAGHGENPNASRHALVVVEQLGESYCFIYARQWPAGADDAQVKNDLRALWRYFRPDTANGDAYGVGMLAILNDELFAEGLTTVDRRAIGGGESTASTWAEWAFSPIRFEGMVKHSMAKALRQVFANHAAVVPMIETGDDTLSDTEADLAALVRQLPNICEVPTKTSYSSYKMANKKLGDDLFDAAMAAVWGLVLRQAAGAELVILSAARARERILQARQQPLPSDIHTH